MSTMQRAFRRGLVGVGFAVGVTVLFLAFVGAAALLVDAVAGQLF